MTTKSHKSKTECLRVPNFNDLFYEGKTKHYTQTTLTNILKRALKKTNEVDINLYNFLKHSSITQAHRDGVSGADLAMVADINIQTLQKYWEADIVERELSVFDRVVNLRDSVLDSKS